MSDFVPITINTQEELNAMFADRAEQARRSEAKKYEGYLSPEDAAKKYEGYLTPEAVAKKYEGYLSPEDAAKKYEKYLSPEDADQLNKKIKDYETASVKSRIAHDLGLPYGMDSRLTGTTEEEIKKDAEMLKKLLGPQKAAPLAGESKEAGDSKKEAYKNMLRKIKGEE